MDEFDHMKANDRFHRLECLKLAQEIDSVAYTGHSSVSGTSRVLNRAKEYADFVNGPGAEALSAAATAPGHLRDAEVSS